MSTARRLPGSRRHRLRAGLLCELRHQGHRAGLAERTVRVAEQQGQMMAAVIVAALAEANLSPEDAQRVKAAVASEMRELSE